MGGWSGLFPMNDLQMQDKGTGLWSCSEEGGVTGVREGGGRGCRDTLSLSEIAASVILAEISSRLILIDPRPQLKYFVPSASSFSQPS